MNSFSGTPAKAANRFPRRSFLALPFLCLFPYSHANAQLPAFGVTGAHDPSNLSQFGDDYIYFCTGQGILTRESTNMLNWTNGPAVFATQPAWTTTAVPGFTGLFWAPSVTYFGGEYRMYYAVSTFGSQVSAIGEATNTTLDPSSPNYDWVDQGPVIESNSTTGYNAIDPSILVQQNGSVYMSFGSFFGGIYTTKLNPTTGMPLNSSTTRVADNSQIEASYLYQHGSYYYMFVNFGACCEGVDSTYNIRMGRSTSPTGPFFDENGDNMLQEGGTLLLGSQGRYIGPGQVGILNQGNDYWMSYHYYDGNNNGTPTYAIDQLYWNSTTGWPTLGQLTWNNKGGTGDGVTWDTTSQNWNTGTPTTYTDGSNIMFDDVNGGGASYSVTLNTTVSPGDLTFENNSGNYSISGTGSIAGSGTLAKLGNAALTLNTVNTFTGGIVMNGGKLIVGVSGALSDGPVSINGGALQLAANTGLTQMTSLTIASGGPLLDINNNHVIINYSGASPAATIYSYLASGYNGGGWNGPGIQSTAAALSANNASYGVGFVDGADNIAGADSSPGVPLTSGQILIAYALYGDVNLDGLVNATDFAIFGANFNSAATGWEHGDFTYTGLVNATDFALLGENFGKSANGTAIDLPAGDYLALEAFAAANGISLTSVPEPASLGLITLCTMNLLARRRRNV